jgi:hypothetical protein
LRHIQIRPKHQAGDATARLSARKPFNRAQDSPSSSHGSFPVLWDEPEGCALKNARLKLA